jgi:hypothetical protein
MLTYTIHQLRPGGGAPELEDQGYMEEEFPYIQDAACDALGSHIAGGVTIEEPSTTYTVTVVRDNGERCTIKATLNYVHDTDGTPDGSATTR